jgi:hypothetical protein
VPDVAPDGAGPGPDLVAAHDGGANPARLWLNGPEGAMRLSDVEPATPF